MFLAWAVGLGLMSWRSVQEFGRPPVPGRLLGASLVFAALSLLAEYEPARRAAVLAAWGFDVAVLLQLPPGALTKGSGWITGEGGKSQATDPGQAAATSGRGSLKQHRIGG